MNVVISAGGKFHSQQLAHQLQKHHVLKRLFTFDYSKQDHDLLNSHFVTTALSCQIINKLFLKLRFDQFIDKSYFNNVKDNLFDHIVRRKLKTLDSIDIFVGWAHYSFDSMKEAKKIGALTILESGSSHVMTQNEILTHEYRRWKIPFQPIHKKTAEKMCQEYQEADYIMTLSSFAKNSFISNSIPGNKILLVPCGVDIDFFINSKKQDYTSKKNTKFRIIFVGMITLRKGIQHLIAAWHKANLPLNNTELIIVGAKQKDFTLIQSQLPIRSNIIFTGPVDKQTLLNLYQQSSLFVLPSLEDGFGMVLGEAMACGLPIICSHNTAASDLITQGVHGFLFSPGDIKELTEKIIWAYQHPQDLATIGQQAHKHIQSFSWDAYGERIIAMYKSILAHKHKKN